ncbi:CAAX amino terminal protease self- immunity [Polystyrenella longa]|uniref:CAAX amino terminal protease self-immunity n=1 Tax=Polystyrenella longa TaxID=2528007 RepID=A0A518CPA3_9PLAN|nr:CPBP family intramembrane glutamic endopeptidase [Polystyrenella longa]QDU81050.1 CAAX amino terminal protease self- immunity [Polystyrenella longa]
MAVSYVKKKKETIPLTYWEESRQPWACLLFLTPLIGLYEFGVWYLADQRTPDALRNGADAWMRSWLGTAGLNGTVWAPMAVLLVLFLWHLLSWGKWKVSGETLVGMLAESLIFALGLIVVGQTQGLIFQQVVGNIPLSIFSSENVSRAVTFIGAGIYEEFLFRLCLLPACYGFFRLIKVPVRWATIGAIVWTSLIFSAAHYIGAGADTFQLFTFVFRAVAGGFFACLFCFRGFGITVGCHATYDLLVGLYMAANINQG